MTLLSKPSVSRTHPKPLLTRVSLCTDDEPSVAESDVSSQGYISDDDMLKPVSVPKRMPLQWKFYGLTLWIELEEFSSDLSSCLQAAANTFGVDPVPLPHLTAIYGMSHLSPEEAVSKLHQIPQCLENGWPVMEPPVAVKQDISEEGRPGQVCTISWSELTFRTNEAHEDAMNKLHSLFDMPERRGIWTPHLSIAYDNPENTVLNLPQALGVVAQYPTLLTKERRVKAISLWSTKGRMDEWSCLDRINLC